VPGDLFFPSALIFHDTRAQLGNQSVGLKCGAGVSPAGDEAAAVEKTPAGRRRYKSFHGPRSCFEPLKAYEPDATKMQVAHPMWGMSKGAGQMQIGVDSFAAAISDPVTGQVLEPVDRMQHLLEEIELADRVGLDVFGIGEHHRAEFLDSAPVVILSAAAARTKNIRLTSAVTVLSAADPVRVFQEFATLDLISRGRAEIVAGRGSFVESFPLFGLKLEDYDSLFAEKLELLLTIRENTHVQWSGKYRAALTGQAVFPRPLQNPLPIWVGVGGTPESFARAGILGLPLMVAIIGGEPKRFRPLIDLYREAGRRAGHSPDKLMVGLHSIGFLGDTTREAADDFFPGYAHTFTEIGKERGWPPTTRAQFDAVRGPTGALLIGDAETVAKKILYVNEVLGGLSRITFQMGVSTLPHPKMLRAIEILGTRVAPMVRKELAASTARA
jgi:probable LLM family oxidoreductase